MLIYHGVNPCIPLKTPVAGIRQPPGVAVAQAEFHRGTGGGSASALAMEDAMHLAMEC